VLGWQPATTPAVATARAKGGHADDDCSEGTSLIDGALQRDNSVRGVSDSTATLARQLASSCANPMLVASVVSVMVSLIGESRRKAGPA